MKILVVGCGYVGTAIGLRLLQKGAEVWAIRRDEASCVRLKAQGFQVIQGDIVNAKTIPLLQDFEQVIFCQAPQKDYDRYRPTYYDGTRNILAKLNSSKKVRVVFISSTSVYSTKDGSWVDESTDPAKDGYSSKELEEKALCLLDSEALVLKSSFEGMVLRLGGIYGPKRHRIASIQNGRIKPSFTGQYMNRIHLEDIVKAVLLLLEKGVPGEIYIGVDDYPSTEKEFYSWLLDQLGLPAAISLSAVSQRGHGTNKRCSNTKLKSLGMIFEYPSFREGYAWLLKEGAK